VPLNRRPWRSVEGNRENLSPELCAHPERGCPLAALAPELARADKGTKPQIVAELANYKSQMLPFIPGRRTVDQERTFFAIFSTMIGAVEMARVLLDPAREKVLASTRDSSCAASDLLNHEAQQRLWHVVLIPGKPRCNSEVLPIAQISTHETPL
jgi:hypothetical protein